MRKVSIRKGFIQRWFQKQLQYAYSNKMSEGLVNSTSSISDHFYFQKGLNIKVFFASNGGKVVKINKFDDNVESSNQEKLYIINENDDFGTAINNIVTLEALR